MGVVLSPPIHGVSFHPRRVISDDRGSVLHMLRNDSPEFTVFGEVYFSEVLPGVVKAWKRHERMTQRFAVPVGRVRFVLHDARPGSPTENQTTSIKVGRDEDYGLLIIPPKVWYGFMGLSSATALIVNCADLPHDPHEAESRPVGAPGFPDFDW